MERETKKELYLNTGMTQPGIEPGPSAATLSQANESRCTPRATGSYFPQLSYDMESADELGKKTRYQSMTHPRVEPVFCCSVCVPGLRADAHHVPLSLISLLEASVTV
jgi:hypothetical protein